MVATGGIVAVPTSQPVIFVITYGRGRGLPRPYGVVNFVCCSNRNFPPHQSPTVTASPKGGSHSGRRYNKRLPQKFGEAFLDVKKKQKNSEGSYGVFKRSYHATMVLSVRMFPSLSFTTGKPRLSRSTLKFQGIVSGSGLKKIQPCSSALISV